MPRSPLLVRWQHWAIFVTLAAVLILTFRNVWRPLAGAEVRVLADEDLNLLEAPRPGGAVVTGAGLRVKDGFAITRGAQAEVRLVFPERRDAPTANAVRLWIYRAGGISNRFECSSDSGRTFRPVAADVDGAGVYLLLPQCATTGDLILRVQLDGSSIGDASQHLALDKVQLLWLSGQPTAPDLIQPTSGWMLLAVAVFGSALVSRGFMLPIAAGAITLGLVTAAHRTWPGGFSPRPEMCYLSAVSAAGLVAFASSATWSWVRNRVVDAATYALAVAFVLTLAFQGRWNALVGSLVEAPSPDVETVLGLIAAMSGPYDTGLREPAWLWGVRAAEWVWGENTLAARMFSLTCSLVLVGLTYLFARMYLRDRLAALAALCVVGVSPTLVDSSVAGHRTELYAAALMIVALFALGDRWGSGARTWGLAGGFSLTLLTQSAGAIPALGGAVWCWLRGRIRVVQLAAVIVIAAAAVLPHAIDNQRRYGQAFHFARTLVPTFYRNYEFMMRGGSGCDGCPTPAELQRSSYSGRPATMFEYLFRLHTFGEVVRRIALGHLQVFFLPTSHSAAILGSSSLLLFALYLIGFVTAAATAARELLLIPLLSVNLLAFIVPIGLDDRLLLHIAPFAAVLVGVAVGTLAAALAQRRPGWLRVPRSHAP